MTEPGSIEATVIVLKLNGKWPQWAKDRIMEHVRLCQVAQASGQLVVQAPENLPTLLLDALAYTATKSPT